MVLQFHHRKFIKRAVSRNEKICDDLCDSSDDSGVCPPTCANYCPYKCKDYPYLSYPPPPPPSLPPHHPNKGGKLLIISLTLLAAALLAIAIYGIYVKLYLGWYASRRRSRSEARALNQTHNEFVDEDHGPVVDHHVWYIQTVGLQPSVIGAITVCKFKKGDGLVEGTECSVCLNEFQEDETLRLLPKCNHAFHIPCIDTWLRSHTNCPMCRAPIVRNSARASSSSSSSASVSASNTGNSSSRIESGDARVEILEENGEAETGLGDDEVVEEEEMVEMQPMRRSVSLDSLSALKISQALANSDTHLAEDRGDQGTEIVPKRDSRNDSLARFVASTSSIRRSLSCSGKFLLSRSGCTRDSN